MRLIWGNGAGLVNNDAAAWAIANAPALSFEFDGLHYSPDQRAFAKRIGGGSAPLSDDERTEIAGYISGLIAPALPALLAYVPQSVTMRQARLALLSAGLLAAVDASVAAMGGTAEIEWEFAADVRRDNPLVVMLLPAIGLTSDQVDELFTAAATL